MLFERPDFFEKGFYSTQILFCKFIILLDQHPQSSHSHAIFTAPTSLLTLKMFSDPLKRFLPPVKLCLWLNLLSTPSPIFSSCLVACSLGYTPPPPPNSLKPYVSEKLYSPCPDGVLMLTCTHQSFFFENVLIPSQYP